MGEERGDDGQDGGRRRRRDQLREKNHTTRSSGITCPFSSPHTKPRARPLLSPPPCKPPGAWVLPQVPQPRGPRGRVSVACQTPPHASRREVAGRDKLPRPQSPVGAGGAVQGGNTGTHPALGLSAPALLRMCLPDILCPRFSPQGPERPARTEDAARGESWPPQGRGAETGLSRGRGLPAFPRP